MNGSEKLDQLGASIFSLHRDLENPKKDAKGQVRGNPNYRYLSLPALIDHAKKPLKDAGLAAPQEVIRMDGGVGVVTRLIHISGQWIEFGPTFVPAGNDAQAYGSATTYARRYSLAAALGLAADEDDDGSRARTSGGNAPEREEAGSSSTEGANGSASSHNDECAHEFAASKAREGWERCGKCGAYREAKS